MKQAAKEKKEEDNRPREERAKERLKTNNVVTGGESRKTKTSGVKPPKARIQTLSIDNRLNEQVDTTRDAQTTSNTSGNPVTTVGVTDGGTNKPPGKKQGKPKKGRGRPAKPKPTNSAPDKGSTANKTNTSIIKSFFQKGKPVISEALGSKPGGDDQQGHDYMKELAEHQRAIGLDPAAHSDPGSQ